MTDDRWYDAQAMAIEGAEYRAALAAASRRMEASIGGENVVVLNARAGSDGVPVVGVHGAEDTWEPQ